MTPFKKIEAFFVTNEEFAFLEALAKNKVPSVKTRMDERSRSRMRKYGYALFDPAHKKWHLTEKGRQEVANRLPEEEPIGYQTKGWEGLS